MTSTATPPNFAQIVDVIRQSYEAPDLKLAPDTTLMEPDQYDPDEFLWCMKALEQRFAMKQPSVVDRRRYVAALSRWHGVFEIGYLRVFLDRRPIIQFGTDTTLADLCSMISAGTWPSELVLPPGAVEEGLVDMLPKNEERRA